MELLRVVDKQGNNTNEILEREELHSRNKLHNEVTIYIINNNNEVLLQRRSKNRRFSPDKLGVIAGHSLYNENPIETAIREVKEEVGLKINKKDIHELLPKYLVIEEYNNHYMYPYYVISDLKEKDFSIQKEELQYVKWYNIDDIIDMINSNNQDIVFKKEEILLFNKLKDINLHKNKYNNEEK